MGLGGGREVQEGGDIRVLMANSCGYTAEPTQYCKSVIFQLKICCSVAQSCPALCDPMDYNMPGFPIFRCLLESAQTHVY